MFLVNEILNFSPGRRQEGLDRLAWIHSLMAPNPGFMKAIVAKYLGDGTRHTILRMWEDEAAFLKFRETPDGNYGRNRPQGLYVNDPVVPQWNSVGGQSIGTGSFLIKAQRTVPDTAWEALAKNSAAMMEAQARVGGAGMSFRAKDRSEALTVARFASRADYERMLEDAGFVAAYNSRPEGVVLTSIAAFEIVSEVLPKT